MTDLAGIAADQLKSIVERYEGVMLEKEEIAETAKEILKEANGNGFNAGVIKDIVKLRKLEPDARREWVETMGIYMSALDMDVRLPLFRAADDREGVVVSIAAVRSEKAEAA